jgi:hypothetical protein
MRSLAWLISSVVFLGLCTSACNGVSEIEITEISRQNVEFKITTTNGAIPCLRFATLKDQTGLEVWTIDMKRENGLCITNFAYPNVPKGFVSTGSRGLLKPGKYLIETMSGAYWGKETFEVI